MSTTDVPLACTLSIADFKARAKWFNVLTSEALLSHEIHGSSARLHYKLDVFADIKKLIRNEQVCCAFLQFEVVCRSPVDGGEDYVGCRWKPIRKLYLRILYRNHECPLRVGNGPHLSAPSSSPGSLLSAQTV